MNTQNKGQNIHRSIFSGVGVAILYLLIGTVLDYVVTQVVSQFFSHSLFRGLLFQDLQFAICGCRSGERCRWLSCL